jgi:ABC-type bacteriocin/lantibiotic exporter with double-glycine peptidase domain
MKSISYSTAGPSGLLRRVVAAISTVALAILVLMFSAVLLAVILIVAALAGIYLWWKTREVRKHLQSQMQNFSAHSTTTEHDTFTGEVIEGEVISVNRPGGKIDR